MKYTLPTSIFIAIAALIVLIDQITKYCIKVMIPLGISVPIIPKGLYFSHATNTGASFSLFTSYSFILGLIAGAVIAGIIVFYNKIETSYRFPVALILGGTIGNLIDRILLGHVTDFIDIRIWPIFNIADSAITIAAILLVYIVWQEEKQEKLQSNEE
ncbi:MAG: signal peptidase II [Candidatus Woesearchaeota archaeon]|jgi:signal peptidase II